MGQSDSNEDVRWVNKYTRILRNIKKEWKLILQITIGILSLTLAVYFIQQERTELTQVKTTLFQAKPFWLISGMVLIGVFVVVQGLMYQYSFRAVKRRIPLKIGMLLYLKRNFISIFIPAGTLTNILFFNKEIEENQGIEKKYIYYASSIFSICSILSSILVAIPAVVLLFLKGGLKIEMVYGISGAVLLLVFLIWIIMSIIKKGFVYLFIQRKVPSLTKMLDELRQHSLDKLCFIIVLGLSCVIELIGIAHLYIAMGALGITPSLSVAVIGYALVLIILLSSPFLRGLGAVELALTYALTLFDYNAVNALSVVFLFRFFDFWSVMVLGLVVLIFKKDGWFMQLLAPVLMFLLGIVNLLSALTPALTTRVNILRNFIPYDVIEFSNAAVLVIGVILIATSVALFRGYKNSYFLALFLSVLSLLGHLFKGIDYEEASLAAIVVIVLFYQRKTYYIKSVPLKFIKWQYGLIAIGGVMIYGIFGFYMLDAEHFHANFSFGQSIVETFKSIILLDSHFHPATPFGRYFLYSLNMLGGSSILYFIWMLYKQITYRTSTESLDLEKGKQLIRSYGKSSMDYFKTYEDKQLYFFDNDEGFIAFKTTSRYAVVLENPVTKNSSSEVLTEQVAEFDAAMLAKNLNTIYYRIPENDIGIYEALGKKKLFLGEEAYVNLETFTLKGKGAQTLRNSVNKVTKAEFIFRVNEAPQNDGFLQQLAYVSDKWLENMGRSELAFSQGYFLESELKNQTILTVENGEGAIVAFLNIIENSVPDQINFDLMRKTADAPNGAMDFLFAEMMIYYSEQGYKSICLGMVPLSGIDKPDNVLEQALKLTYERIGQFSHYKSLRFFKEKFNPYWIKMYAAYDTDLDLLNLIRVLSSVMKPKKVEI